MMSADGIQEVSAVKGVIPAEYEDAIGGTGQPGVEIGNQRLARICF